ncbi:MAG TPA: benzoate-CoA ligase family protein, partial [Longimicrobiales bacterium]
MRARATGRSVLLAPPEVLASFAAPPDTLPLPREYNAADHFIDRHLREGRGTKVALVDDAGETSYAWLAQRVNRAGNALRALGLDVEQRVLICMLDTADFPAVFWGAIKAGAVAVPVNTLLSAADYAHMLRDSRARLVVVSAPLYPKLETALHDLPFLRAVVVAGAAPGELPLGTVALEDVLDAAAPELAAAPTTPDDVAFWLYSSGSTGVPKGAVHLHQDLVHTAVLYGERVLGIREDDVVFSAAKLFFAYGLGNAMTFPLQVGATAVLLAGRPTPQAVMETLQRHQPTIFYGVPTLFASILADEGNARDTGSRRLRICASAGEALPREIGERWARRMGADILDGLGSTELL